MSRVRKRKDIALCTDAIDKEVTEKDPCGHILTDPVAITKAEPDDMLEVQILKVNFDVNFACNGLTRWPTCSPAR